METKYELKLGYEYAPGELNTAVITSLSCEYLLDLLRSTIRKYNKETDMTDFMEKYSALVDSSYDVAFTSMSAWINFKSKIFNRALAMIKEVDDRLTEKGIAKAETVCADIQSKLNEFVLSLAPISVDSEYADFGKLDIDDKFIKITLDQIRLVDEGTVLAQINGMELEFTPLDIESNRNAVIEKKLNKINAIAESCEKVFDDRFNKLLDQVEAMYQKFYTLAFASLTDGEKAEKARNLVKTINPHRQILDKLENKLTQANELKRQLSIHSKRLKENFAEKHSTIDEKIKANPNQWEMYETELDSVEYMAEKYSKDIIKAIDRVNAIEEQISEHYKTLDQLEIALKSAIPSKDELKRYTSIGFKLQDLCVRLELSKSQIQKGDKDMKGAVDTAITALSTLIAYSTDIKELYLRNSMVTAIFRAVNAVYNFEGDTNEQIAVSQIKFVTDKLTEYNSLFSTFTADMLTYRKVCNNTIRDVSIIMGKSLDLKGVVEIIDTNDISIKQVQSLNETLEKNNRDQIEILKAILDR